MEKRLENTGVTLFQLFKKFPHILWNGGFITVITAARQ
jgi:hypothetical protein